MTPPIDITCVTPVQEMQGESPDETRLLFGMLSECEAYLKSFRWYTAIQDKYLGFAIPDVLALFLFRFDPPVGNTDEWLWAVVGDLPSAHFVLDCAPDPRSALNVYCELMDEWVQAVIKKHNLDGVFPVNAPPTAEYAEMLRGRIEFFRDRLIVHAGGRKGG